MVRFIPRETKFFELFADIANNVVEGAKALSDLLHNYDYELCRQPSPILPPSNTAATSHPRHHHQVEPDLYYAV